MKTLYGIVFISSVLLFGLLASIASAQIDVPDVSEPDPVSEGETIQFVGENLNEQITVDLHSVDGYTWTLDVQVQSPQRMVAPLPEGVTAGLYQLCVTLVGEVFGDCFRYEVKEQVSYAITEISPATVLNTKEQSISVVLNQPLASHIDPVLRLDSASTQITAPETTISVMGSIRAAIPFGQMPGTYDAIVSWGSTTLTYTRALTIVGSQIVTVSPPDIYNNRQEIVTVTMDLPFDRAIEPSLSLYNVSTEITTTETNVSAEGDVVGAVPPQQVTGTYDAIVSWGSTALTYTDAITIWGPISASLKSVEPQRVLRFADPVELTITGQNLSLVEGIDLFFPGLPFPRVCSEWVCDFVVLDDSTIRLETKLPSSYNRTRSYWNRTGDVTLRMNFPDGSAIDSADQDVDVSVTVVNRASPWDLSSALFLLLLTLLPTAGVTVVLFGYLFTRHQARWSSNRQAPPLPNYLLLVVGVAALSLLLVWLIRLAVIGAFEDDDFLPVFSSALASINSVLPFVVVWIRLTYAVLDGEKQLRFAGRFFQKWPWLPPLAMGLLAWQLPNLLTFFWLPQWTIAAEAILLVAIIAWGMLELLSMRQRLEIERNRVSDEQLALRIEQTLWQEGDVVRQRDFENVAADRVEQALATYYQRHRDHYGLIYEPSNGSLAFIRQAAMREISYAFDEAHASAAGEPMKHQVDVRTLAERLSERLQFVPRSLEHVPEDLDPDFHILGRRAEELESNLPDPFPLIFYSGGDAISRTHLEHLKQVLNTLRVSHRFAFFIPLGNVAATQEAIDTTLRRQRATVSENMVVFGKRDVLQILASSKGQIREALMDAVHEQVELRIFSPYIRFGPTPRDMFFGRSREMTTAFDTIDDDRSVTIMGTRRMGKTSLLHAIRYQLEDADKLVLYADCQGVHSHEDFYYRIAAQWRLPEMDFGQYTRLGDFAYLVRDLQDRYPQRPLVFLFDEIDALLAYDLERREPFFRMLRGLSQEKRCQYIFSGERAILDAIVDARSAFYNFTEPVRLDLFDRETTSELVCKPFELIGVKLSDVEGIVDVVQEYTEGHPNLIQALCQECLQVTSASGQRTLSVSTVQKEAEHMKHQAEGDNAFVSTFLSQADVVEQAVAVYVARYEPVVQADLLQGLRDLGFHLTLKRLDRGLRYLQLGHVLVRSDGSNYGIKPVRFTEFLFTIPYEERIEILLEEQREVIKDGNRE